MRESSSSLKRVGTGVVIQESIRTVERESKARQNVYEGCPLGRARLRHERCHLYGEDAVDDDGSGCEFEGPAGLAALVLGEAFTRRLVIAGLAGMAGVAMLVLGPAAQLDPVGIAAAVAGTVSMAFGVVLTKRWGRPVGLVAFAGWQLCAGGIVLLPVVLLLEGLPNEITAGNVAGFVWLAAVGTGAAYANWFAGIERLPVSTVSFLGLLSPLAATVVGWVFLSESLTPIQFVGVLLVVFAAVAPNLERLPTTQSATPSLSKMCDPLSG